MTSLTLQTFISFNIFFVKISFLDAFLIKTPILKSEASSNGKLDFFGDDYKDYNVDYIADLKDFSSPVDPMIALRCTTFVCLLSKFDILKVDQGYSVERIEVKIRGWNE
jgi:hypothetical protein